jgi:hypothetical protein
MTRMRKAALAAVTGAATGAPGAAPIAQHARRAWMLRMGIGLASLAVFVIALATP